MRQAVATFLITVAFLIYCVFIIWPAFRLYRRRKAKNKTVTGWDVQSGLDERTRDLRR